MSAPIRALHFTKDLNSGKFVLRLPARLSGPYKQALEPLLFPASSNPISTSRHTRRVTPWMTGLQPDRTTAETTPSLIIGGKRAVDGITQPIADCF
jgi:hypothetical protein